MRGLFQMKTFFFAMGALFLLVQCGGGGSNTGSSSTSTESSQSLVATSQSLDDFYAQQNSQGGSSKSQCMDLIYHKAISDLSIFQSPPGLVPPCTFTGYDARHVSGSQTHDSSATGQEFDGKILAALGVSSHYSDYLNVNPKASACSESTVRRGPSIFTSSDCGTISMKGCYDCPRSPDLVQPDSSFNSLKCTNKTTHVASSITGANVSISFYANETAPDSLVLQGGSFNIMIGELTDEEVYQGKNPGGAFHFSALSVSSASLKLVKVNMTTQAEEDTGEVINYAWNPATRTVNIDLGTILSTYRDKPIALLITSGELDALGLSSFLQVACEK